MSRVLARFALTVVIAAGLYFLVYRPMQLRWGASDADLARSWPGDDIQQHPMFDATRGVTINTPPETIWPWLIQWGYRRAGLYSALNWADNGGVPSSARIIPECSTWKSEIRSRPPASSYCVAPE
jgi:hypothetical protein